MAGALNEEMVASYEVDIVGIQRTKNELKKLDNAIATLRKATYSESVPTVTVAGSFGGSDIFSTKMDALEGRVQTGVQEAMSSSMALGRKTQAAALRAATTPTGLSGRPAGRRGPGREVTGAMIRDIATNIETMKTTGDTKVLGWHGWSTSTRGYYEFQEQGTGGRGSLGKSKAAKAGVVYRKPNAAKGRTTGRAGARGGGIQAANSLGTSIVPVREHLKAELGKIRK